LAVLQYSERDGRPAAGVVPTDFSGRPISARFLADDRQTLLPPSTQFTGASGIAIVGAGSVQAAAGGIRNRDFWPPTGVLFADDWVFVESLDLAPPVGQ
jgi:hypothetical protein